jgi:hypothetical protein
VSRDPLGAVDHKDYDARNRSVRGVGKIRVGDVSVVGALLFLLGSAVIAFSVFRRPSAGETEANAGS